VRMSKLLSFLCACRLGTESCEQLQTFVFNADDDCWNIDDIIETFKRHCVGETNETYQLYVLSRRVQETNETRLLPNSAV